MSKFTTIQLNQITVEKLKHIKIDLLMQSQHVQIETSISYDDVLNFLLDLYELEKRKTI